MNLPTYSRMAYFYSTMSKACPRRLKAHSLIGLAVAYGCWLGSYLGLSAGAYTCIFSMWLWLPHNMVAGVQALTFRDREWARSKPYCPLQPSLGSPAVSLLPCSTGEVVIKVHPVSRAGNIVPSLSGEVPTSAIDCQLYGVNWSDVSHFWTYAYISICHPLFLSMQWQLCKMHLEDDSDTKVKEDDPTHISLCKCVLINLIKSVF